MKLIGAAFGIAAMCAAGAAAQTRTVHQEGTEKVEVKDGKKITIHGCLERAADGAYIVTNDDGRLKYELITEKNLSDDVGRLVEVRGKAADRGDAKVKIESKGTSGSTATTTTDAELKGHLDLKYLGVDSVKRLSKSCR